jgi:nucleoside-diphosphate-sugar epimerase
MQLAGKRVLVTGASGFIGRALCRRLAGEMVAVQAVSRGEGEVEHAAKTWRVDLADPRATHQLIVDTHPDYIVHLAGHVVGARDLHNVAPSFRDTLHSTVNLLTAATEHQCDRLVLAGSLEEPFEGDLTQAVPSSPYAAAKFSARMFAKMFHALYQTPAVMTRIFMVYGPGQRDLNKLIPHVALSLLRGQSPQLTSGRRMVDWVFVDDVIEGLVRTLQAPGLEGETVDLGSGILTSVQEIAEKLCHLHGGTVKPLFGSMPDRLLEQERFARVDHTRELLGYAPCTPLEEGLSRTLEWYRSQVQTGAAT